METKSTTKIARTSPEIGNVDRLSSLPDEVISYILSFMETKYAVGTAVLSRRWQHHWARVSNIDIDSRLVYKHLDLDAAAQNLPPDLAQKHREGEVILLALESILSDIQFERDLEFCRFADRVLSQHQNLDSLRRFRFHFSAAMRKPNTPSPDFRFQREFAFGPLVEEIDLKLWGANEFGFLQSSRCLPPSFYTMKNLTVVKLEGVMLSAANEPVFLPSVKMLRLSCVKIEDFKSLGKLISGCPALKTALLDYCFLCNMNEKDILEVSSPSLKNLKIIDSGKFNVDWRCPVIVEAPNLEDFYIKVSARLQFMSSKPLPCLQTAYVDIDKESRGDLIGVFNQIANAKKLSLSVETLMHLSVFNDAQLPVFPNLTHLTIEMVCSSWVLYSLLNSSTKLRSLVIDMVNCTRLLEWDMWEHLGTPKCLLSSLEQIEIKNIYADADLVVDVNEMKLIAYLLEAGVVLKKVNVHVQHSYLRIRGGKNLASLLKLPMGSSSCESRVLLPNNKEIRFPCNNEADFETTI